MDGIRRATDIMLAGKVSGDHNNISRYLARFNGSIDLIL